jgi:hypothetical protein
MVLTIFTVGNSVFRVNYPGIARKYDRVTIDGVEFVVATDGVVVVNTSVTIDTLTGQPLPSTYVTATLGTNFTLGIEGK